MCHLLFMDQKPSLLLLVIGAFFKWKPLLFGFGILMPGVTQALILLRAPLPDTVHPLWIGFAVAAVWGGIAQWKGRWI